MRLREFSLKPPRSIIICGEGILRQANGYQHMLHLIDLAWVTGKLGKQGCGINTFTEEANEQGAVDMGVAPEFLPGAVSFSDCSSTGRLQPSLEYAALPDMPNTAAHLIDILDRCRKGEIKALICGWGKPTRNLAGSPSM